MRMRSAAASGSFGLTMVLATASTMPRAAPRHSWCSGVEIRRRRGPISARHRPIGMTTNGESGMSKLSKDYRETLLEDLHDPQEAAAYLTVALEEGDSAVFLLALRNVADARGMSAVAAKAQLNRESLYRMLSERGNPQLDSLTALLEALDLRLAITVK